MALEEVAVVVELPYAGTSWLVREILRGAGDLVVLEPEDAREAIAKEHGNYVPFSPAFIYYQERVDGRAVAAAVDQAVGDVLRHRRPGRRGRLRTRSRQPHRPRRWSRSRS